MIKQVNKKNGFKCCLKIVVNFDFGIGNYLKRDASIDSAWWNIILLETLPRNKVSFRNGAFVFGNAQIEFQSKRS